MSVEELAEELKRRGVRVRSQHGKLSLEAAQGVVTDELLRRVSAHKRELGALAEVSLEAGTQTLVPMASSREPRVRLFCFAYSGASVSCYAPWASEIERETELYGLELPGRGAASGLAFATDIHALAARVAREVAPYAGVPMVFFGHSLGALVGFEVARALRRDHGFLPSVLFVSGLPAPADQGSLPRLSELPDDRFRALLVRLGGTRAEVFARPTFPSSLETAIRADFALRDNYRYRAEAPLSCPIVAYGGTEDPAAHEGWLHGWRAETSCSFRAVEFEAGHFFLHSHQGVLQDIKRVIAEFVLSAATR